MKIDYDTVRYRESALGISTVLLEDGRALWMGQDLRVRILEPGEWQQWREYVELGRNLPTTDAADIRSQAEGLFPLHSLAQLQQVATENASKTSRIEFNNHPLRVDYLTVIAPDTTSAAPPQQSDVRRLIEKLVLLCSYNVVVMITHDCHHPGSSLFMKELRPLVQDQSIRPEVICRCSCDDCCNKLLANRDRERLTILYGAAKGVTCRISEEDLSSVNFCLYLDEKDIPISEMPVAIVQLARDYPAYPIKVRTRTFNRAVLEAVRRTPSASFCGCQMQTLFRTLSSPSPSTRPCFKIGSVKAAVDLHGNLYCCEDLSQALGPLGNILQEDGNDLLEGLLSSRRRRFSQCLSTCALALACCGCLSPECSTAKGMLQAGLEPVYEKCRDMST